jgi:hypothetical protein
VIFANASATPAPVPFRPVSTALTPRQERALALKTNPAHAPSFAHAAAHRSGVATAPAVLNARAASYA